MKTLPIISVVFDKTCPLCKIMYSSLSEYMSHIKSKHDGVSPEKFINNNIELKWKLRDV